MGRKLKYGEPTKVFRVRLPISKYDEIREKIENIIKAYISYIEIIINPEPSESNCYNCNHLIKKSYGSSCDNGIYPFDTCELTGKIVDKSTSTSLEYDDGRVERIKTDEYIGNKGCNKWEPRKTK